VIPVTFLDKLFVVLGMEEGKESTAYKDTEGFWTIGIGHLLPGITDAEAKKLNWSDTKIFEVFQADVDKALDGIPLSDECYSGLCDARKIVVASMCFQLGSKGFSAFKRTIGAICSGNYEKASQYLLESKFAKQTPNRAERMAWMLRTGELHEYYNL
jgi:GH24 family phage-related lysozyme (muramidase)